MAALHLVTGYKGTAHITSADQGVLNAMSIGTGDYVFTKGRRFEAEIINNNTIRIHDGCLMMNGRQVNLDAGSYLDATIENGYQDANRHDIIAIRYELDRSSGVESASLVVVKGTQTFDPPTDPVMSNSDSILNGVTAHDMPLYRVVLEGLTITKVEPLFRVLAPMADIQHGFYKQNMLINGDFQCNQRGETTWEVSDTTKYALDMWRIYQIKMQLSTNGLKIARYSSGVPGFLTQFVKVDALADNYTISLRADGQVYTFTTPVTTSIVYKEFDGKFKIGLLYQSAENRIKVNFCPLTTGYVTVKYIDLFEGVVAYPHVKEDYATALMRCRQYIQCNSFVSPPLLHNSSTDGRQSYHFIVGLDRSIPQDAVITECSWQYLDQGVNWVSGTDFEVMENSHEWCKRIKLPYDKEMFAVSKLIHGTYIVSCEPLPNGD